MIVTIVVMVATAVIIVVIVVVSALRPTFGEVSILMVVVSAPAIVVVIVVASATLSPFFRPPLTLLTFGVVLRLGVFIVAADIIYQLFVYINIAFSHSTYILYYKLIVGMLLVILEALGSHISRDVAYRVIFQLFRLPRRGYCAYHLANILAIVFELYAVVAILQLSRLSLDHLARGQRVGRVDIQLKVRYYI